MKKTVYLSVIALLALTALFTSPGMAFEGMTGSATITPEAYLGDEDNAKFNEYHYNRDTEWGGSACINLLMAPEDSTHMLKLDLKYESPEDVKADIESMSYGMYRFNVNYMRMGHVFAYGVRSLYSGNTTDRLRIRDSVQSGAEALTGVALADFLESAVKSSGKIDMQLRRDRLGAELEWMSLDPLTIKANFNYENRAGSRPYGSNFSFNRSIEVPEPIQYNTYDAGIDIAYTDKWLYTNVGYMHSTFDNTYQSFTHDNPFSLSGTLEPARGRTSLPPSNHFDEAHVTLATGLPMNSRLTTNLSYGFFRQNERLLPATINPLVGPVSLPRSTADAKVDKFLAEAVFTSRPINGLNVKIDGKYTMHDNRTPERPFPNVRSDTADEGPEDTTYVSWISRRLGAEAIYEVARRTNVGFAYEYESESYRNGSSRKEVINTFKLTGDTFALDWMNARVALEYVNRNADYPNYTEAELPWLRKFYAADLDRYNASMMTDFTPLDDLSIGLEYIFSMDNYKRSIFGLQDGWHHTASLDIDYSPIEMVSLNAFYSYENHETIQLSRRWLPDGIGDPYVTEPIPGSYSNWQADLIEEVNSVGLGSEIKVIPDLLKLKLDGTFAIVDGDAHFYSRVGTAGVNDNNAFVPRTFQHMDETTWWKACAMLDFTVTKKLSMGAGYKFEDWNVNDYTYDGVTYVKRNTAGAYSGIVDSMTLYQPYTVHTIFLTASYTFD